MIYAFAALILSLSTPGQAGSVTDFKQSAIAETYALDAGDEPLAQCRDKACCTEFDADADYFGGEPE